MCGCDKPSKALEPQQSQVSMTLSEISGEAYQPARVNFLPLSEIITSQTSGEPGKITAYVNLTDAAGATIKSPGTFRFELYEYNQELAESKGKRLAIWAEQDLTGFSDNTAAWRDFLRAYQFDLAFDLPADKTYVIAVTYTSSGGKRLYNQMVLSAR